MQIYEDKQMQYVACNGLQRPSCHTYRKTAHPMHSGGGQGWEPTAIADTLNIYDNSETRTPIVVVSITQDTDDMQSPK